MIILIEIDTENDAFKALGETGRLIGKMAKATQDLMPDDIPAAIDGMRLFDHNGNTVGKVIVNPGDRLIAALESLLECSAGLDQSATKDGLQNVDAIREARGAIFEAKGE